MNRAWSWVSSVSRNVYEAEGNKLKVFAYDIEGADRPISLDAAKQRFSASKFDIGVAQRAMYSKSQLDTLIGIKPSLVMAVYINATHTQHAPGTKSYLPDDFYLYDDNGGPVTAGGDWTGNYLMDPRSGWKDYQEAQAVTLTTNTGFNALYVDEVGVGPIYSVSSPPIDTVTGTGDQPWTWPNWMTEMNALLDGYQAAVSVPVWANGLGNSGRYYAAPTGIAPTGGNTQLLMAHVEGKILAESFLRGAAQPPSFYPSTNAWTREVTMLENGGADLMACSKVWSTYDSAIINRIHRWSLGTFMLGAHANSAWYFTGVRAANTTPWNTLWTTAKNLGAPTGARSGLTRTFDNGTVTVNNTTHDATFTLT